MPAKQRASRSHKSSLCIITQPTIGLPSHNSLDLILILITFVFHTCAVLIWERLKLYAPKGRGSLKKGFPQFTLISKFVHLRPLLLILTVSTCTESFWFSFSWWDCGEIIKFKIGGINPKCCYPKPRPGFIWTILISVPKRKFNNTAVTDGAQRKGWLRGPLGSIPLILGSWFLNGHPPKSHHMMVGVWDGDS